MDEKIKFTILKVEDIDNLMKKLDEENAKTTRMATCPTCSTELPYILTDYYTSQRQECFYSRKPWCQSFPVGDAYFQVNDGLD